MQLLLSRALPVDERKVKDFPSGSPQIRGSASFLAKEIQGAASNFNENQLGKSETFRSSGGQAAKSIRLRKMS
jgi:hypothetical protein